LSVIIHLYQQVAAAGNAPESSFRKIWK